MRALASLLVLCLLLPHGADAAVGTVSRYRGKVGVAGIAQLRDTVGRQILTLDADGLSRLSHLAESPKPSAASTSARLILQTLAAKPHALKESYTLSELLGPDLADRLRASLVEVRRSARADASLRQALSGIASRFDGANLDAAAAELDQLYFGGPGYEPGIVSGRYISPNERNSHLYAPLLTGKQGALIAIGTFRALNDAAHGDFSHVVLLDYDRLATAFNEAHIKLLAEPGDRFDYLARLVGVPKLAAAARKGRLSEKGLVTRGLSSAAKGLGGAAQHLHAALALGGHDGDSLGQELVQRARSEESWKNAFFGSDELFAKVQAMAREGRLRAVNGSLSGSTVLKGVARSLRKVGVRVSVLDLSNVHQHIGQGYGPLSETTLAWKRFISNLRLLPFEKDASILFTEHDTSYPDYVTRRGRPYSVKTPLDDYWWYFAVPAKTLLARKLRDMHGFRRLAFRLVDKAVPSLRARGLIVPET